MADMKLAGAALGGYLLGRTKKGKAAIRLAMWLSGQQPGQQIGGLLQQAVKSPEATQLIAQLRGPILEQAQSAAMAQLMQRLSSLSEAMLARTEALNAASGAAGEAGEKVSDTAGQAQDTVKSALPIGGGNDKSEDGDSESDDKHKDDSNKKEENADG